MRAPAIALLVFLAPAGTHAGRDGLSALRAGDHAAAATHFREGLTFEADEHVEGTAGAGLRAALHNNLGLALLARDSLAQAADAFDAAAGWAAHDSIQAVIAYNAGTALARAERWSDARDRLVRALELRSDFDDARHNLEIVLRQLSGERPPSGGAPPEPSAFARRLKAQADSLVAGRRYEEALGLMQDGLQRDSSVAAFNDFIGRLGEVVGILSPDTLGGPER